VAEQPINRWPALVWTAPTPAIEPLTGTEVAALNGSIPPISLAAAKVHAFGVQRVAIVAPEDGKAAPISSGARLDR
jgi:hypothetical protein